MSATTSIEWCDRTWNPVSGCSKVSPGCKHCYAETIAHRFWKNRPFTEVRCHPERLDEPLHWRKPQRVFVNSMSDLFHEEVPDRFLMECFRKMTCPAVSGLHRGAERHTFQILTKRSGRMRDFALAMRQTGWIPQDNSTGVTWPAKNIWLGASVENQQAADERIPILRETPAAVRFLSVEPLLEKLNLIDHLSDCPYRAHTSSKIDWVIVGGESGPSARPCNIDWIHSIVRQCKAAGVACFVKQLGSRPAWNHIVPGCSVREALEPLNLRDRKGADMGEWPEDLRIREYPIGEK